MTNSHLGNPSGSRTGNFSENFRKSLVSRQFPVEWPGHFLATGWHKSGKIEDTGELRRSQNPGTGEILVATTTEREAKSTLDTAIDLANHARLAMRTIPLDIRMEELRTIRRALGDHSKEAMMALRFEAGLTPAEADMDLSAALRHLDHVLDHPVGIEQALLA
ncbi:MAG: aldehyde dehydrogenase family protein, partial [Proteobacteria bacterium]|nr:aldehyde dehydrogenase family protein [Pseudomonadota bacterium]